MFALFYKFFVYYFLGSQIASVTLMNKDNMIPNIIYLQVDENEEYPEHGEVTWCRDKINDYDVRYFRMKSDIFDINNKEVQIGDVVKLTFNKGEFTEHSALYDVIWSNAAYKLKSKDTLEESYLGALSHYVEIEIF